jgi:hypothetical protein
VPRVNVQPQQVTANQPVTVFADVVNRGDTRGKYAVDLRVNGEIVQSKAGSIRGHGVQPLNFTVSREQPGTYEVEISGQKAYFSVVKGGAGGMRIPLGPVDYARIFAGVLVVATLVFAVLTLRRLGYL